MHWNAVFKPPSLDNFWRFCLCFTWTWVHFSCRKKIFSKFLLDYNYNTKFSPLMSFSLIIDWEKALLWTVSQIFKYLFYKNQRNAMLFSFFCYLGFANVLQCERVYANKTADKPTRWYTICIICRRIKLSGPTDLRRIIVVAIKRNYFLVGKLLEENFAARRVYSLISNCTRRIHWHCYNYVECRCTSTCVLMYISSSKRKGNVWKFNGEREKAVICWKFSLI